MTLPNWAESISSEQEKIHKRARSYLKIWLAITLTTAFMTLYFNWNEFVNNKLSNPYVTLAPIFIVYLSIFGARLYTGKTSFSENDLLASKLFELADSMREATQETMPLKEEVGKLGRTIETVNNHLGNIDKDDLVNSNARKLLVSLKTILLKANKLCQGNDSASCAEIGNDLSAIGQMIHLGNLNSFDILTLTDTVLYKLQGVEELKPQSGLAKLPSAIASQFASNYKFRLAVEIPVSLVFAIVVGTDNATRALLSLTALILIVTVETIQRPKKQ